MAMLWPRLGALLLLSSLVLVRALDQMPGSWRPASKKDKNVDALVLASASEMDARINSEYAHKVISLTNAQTQVVAGTLYKLDLLIGETGCRKEDVSSLEDCEIQDGTEQKCEAVYYLRPWEKVQEVKSFTCNGVDLTSAPQAPPAAAKASLLGGKTATDTEDANTLAAAKFAVHEMNARSNSLRVLVLMDVQRATKQTVQGTKWSLLLKVGESSCVKNRSPDSNQLCSSKVHKTLICNVEVLERSWKDARPFELTSQKCEEVSDVQDPQEDNDKKPNEANSVLKFSSSKQPKHRLPRNEEEFQSAFEEFKIRYNKAYDEAEEAMRYGVFKENMKKAQKLQFAEKGSAVYGASVFADLSAKEYMQMLGHRWDLSADDNMDKAEIPTEGDVPDAWDWRTKGVVSAIKNQGTCGSCWAFSTTGNIEGQWALKKKELVSLSEQELVDCDKVDDGCGGGLPTNAYKFIQKVGGLESEKDYPYEGKDDKCQFKSKEADVYINGSVSISSDEDDMKSWLYKNGPISIGINANAMQFYMGGVSRPWKFFCEPDNLDHGVLIVGYGIEKRFLRSDLPYWIVKNSWGPSWGEQGYYRVYRGGGTCGVNKMPTSAVVN